MTMNDAGLPKSHQTTPRVAVTGVSGDVGMGVIAGLRAGSFASWILGLDYNQDCAGFRLSDAFAQVPAVRSPAYLETVTALILQHRVRLLFCCVDSEVPLMAKWSRQLEQQTGCRIVVGDEAAVRCFADKLDSAAWLQQNGLEPPRTWDCSGALQASQFERQLPLVAKPRSGNASQGISLLQNSRDLADFLASSPVNYCLQEYIDGPEYTCGLLFDSQGKLQDWISMRRELHQGRTVFAEVVQDARLDRFIEHFGSLLCFPGPLNLQLRIDPQGNPRVFEINPRLSGSTSLRVAVGFNDPFRILDHWIFGTPIARAAVTLAKIYRYSTELVLGNPEEPAC